MKKAKKDETITDDLHRPEGHDIDSEPTQQIELALRRAARDFKLAQRAAAEAAPNDHPLERAFRSFALLMAVRLEDLEMGIGSGLDWLSGDPQFTEKFSADGEQLEPGPGFEPSPRNTTFSGSRTPKDAHLPLEERQDGQLQEAPRTLDVIQQYHNEFHAKVWWNRSVMLDRTIMLDRTTKRAPEQAREAWKRLEKKFGPFQDLSDFEWGLLSGRLSALAWVLGSGWADSLDS